VARKTAEKTGTPVKKAVTKKTPSKKAVSGISTEVKSFFKAKSPANKPVVKSFYKATASSSVKESPAAKKRAIVAGKVVNKAIAKPSIRGGAAYKPYTGPVKAVAKIHSKLTPAKSKENKKPKFDLKASLAKKPSWKVKAGKVAKFTDTTKIPNCVMETTI